MSQDTEVNREGAEVQPGVRLRVPERRQMAMVVQCPDDLVPAQHAVRMVMALVETLDLSRFSEPIKAREGVAGGGGAGGSGGSRRDRSAVAGGVVVVRVYSRDRIGAGVGAAVRGEGGIPLAVRRGDGESPVAVGFSRRSRCGSGCVIYAGPRVVGGQGTAGGQPRN